MTSLRKAIDAKCKDCIYDNLAAGTWRQQATLCTVDLCPLWSVRPKTDSAIPNSVYLYYGADLVDSQATKGKIQGVSEEQQGWRG